MSGARVSVIRAAASVLIGMIVGQIVQLVLALALDTAYGHDVTAGRWSLNSANLILTCLVALTIGYIVGSIAKARGKSLAALTIFLPNILLTTMFVSMNRDPSDYFAKNYDTHPSLWVWVGLLPAIIGGHLGMAHKRATTLKLLAISLGIAMVVLWLSSAALHFYTVFVAYQDSGVFGAFISLSAPFAAELYWFVKAWRQTGTAMTGYGVSCMAVVMLGLIVGGGFLLSERLSDNP